MVGAPMAPGRFPLVLFSPGYGGSRATGAALAEDLASHGYLVVAVDHTYEAAAVKFPDGRVIYHDRPAEETPEEIAAAIGVRARDLSFTLTQIQSRWPVDPRRIAAAGHSAGGATAFEAARVDRRIRAAVDLDGGLSAPVTTDGVPVPSLLLTGSWHFDSWTEWADHQRAWGRHLAADGMGHYSFTDAPYYIAPGGLDDLPADIYAELFGTAAPARAAQLTRTYVRAFLDRQLRDQPTALFDRPSHRFPEVAIRWPHR
ncbi:alpha/beta hydrolase family protein [Actinokineospora enzanensis]|uniref:alpha/beta hydrolase family protein n=1 Tax=Actinokineospora enzanensis TaxID=155975 RepID=UPI000363D322|nr:hypothetical protein [Actinokineospora enzanensis]